MLVRTVATAAFLTIVLWPAIARADIKVLPTSASLDATAHVAVFTVQNQSPDQAVMQAKLFAWSDVDGSDRETASTTALLVPPVFTLSAYADQIVRFGLREFAQTDVEQTYRIVFSQVPPKAANDVMSLSVLFAFDMPVFIAPAGRRYYELQWSLDRSDPQHPIVTAHNSGTIHVQLRALRILNAAGATIATVNAPGYILARSTRKWTVALVAGAHPASIEIDTRSNGTARSPLPPAP